jgi:hypothetical protein
MTSGNSRTLATVALLAGAFGAAPASAQVRTAQPVAAVTLAPEVADQPDLYQEALQSIAEGRKNDASETLMRVIEKEPYHAGAYLEVALIQCSLGHAEEAERLFATIETRFNPPRGILDLIANARESGCAHWQAVSNSSLTLGRGIDQNVNQGASNPSYIIDRDGGQIELPLLTDFLPKHDQYTVLGVDYMREVTPNGSIGFAQFQGRRNDNLHQYDSASLYLGVESPYRFGRWTLRTTGMIGMLSLGGQFYQRQLQLQARIGPPVPLPNNTQFSLMGGITHTQYLTLTNFDSNTLELRGQLTYRNSDLYASASLGVLDDRAGTQHPGGSRHGLAANLLLRRSLWGPMTGELGYSRQTWRSQLAYAPGLIDQVRDQATQVARATLSYSIKKNQSLQLEARVVQNREDISIFQYNNRLLQLSWQWQGP